jgi:hypothetical protein
LKKRPQVDFQFTIYIESTHLDFVWVHSITTKKIGKYLKLKGDQHFYDQKRIYAQQSSGRAAIFKIVKLRKYKVKINKHNLHTYYNPYLIFFTVSKKD